MNIQARQSRVGIKEPKRGNGFFALWFCVCAIFLSYPAALAAQGDEQQPVAVAGAGSEPVEEIAELTVSLPDSHEMALALATPGSRSRALLDLASAMNTLNRADGDSSVDHAALAQHFLDDRAWLQLLVDRYGWTAPHSAILDPAAWMVLLELQQNDLEGMDFVFPGRVPEAILIYQVFHRAGERLAAANLPVLLFGIEANATSIWDIFLQLTSPEGVSDPAWKAVENALLTNQGMQVPLPQQEESQKPVAADVLQAMSKLVSGAVDEGPPDVLELVRLRYSLLSAMPELDGIEGMLASDVLYLSILIDGLHGGRYFEFARGLLSITSGLLEKGEPADETFSLVDWLVLELPAISVHYASDFAKIDPRLNAVMAATYGVLRNIVDPDGKNFDVKASRAILADVVAQLALLVPDMAYYFDTPVRSRIVVQVNACIGFAAVVTQDDSNGMTRRQFDDCMEALLQLADNETRLAELSGHISGPFTTETLRRELSVTPWQRINYGIGYLHHRYSTGCQPPEQALPNPLEWSVLATTMAWFGEHFPEFFQTPENEIRLTRMRSVGEQLILAMAEQADCLAGDGSGINDPVSRGMTDYELALRELNLGIDDAILDFRTQRLNPGADVSLAHDALQKTSYRPDDLIIQPCDSEAFCEMSGSLSTTRALIGLFPDEYLVAEQTGMGRIEICYRDMEWVQRRSELVRADDENVANYFGRFGFDLVGRYVENDQASEIFGFRFTSPEEYHYLFAQTSEDVLNDSCPVEWVGSRVVTPLREDRGGVVPNRLTYLAASRKLPSRLLQNNWDRGAEWRDWFVTGIGVASIDMPPAPEITSRLNQHLQSLYQAEQTEIYQRVLLPNVRDSQGDDVSLFNEMLQVSIAKALIRMQMMLFYPESLFASDSIRMAVAGDAGLLEGRTLRRFREEDLALTSVNNIARERLNELRDDWSKQPEAVRRQGSIPASLMYSLGRINRLYRQFFTSRPEPLQEIEVTAQPQGQNQ